MSVGEMTKGAVFGKRYLRPCDPWVVCKKQTGFKHSDSSHSTCYPNEWRRSKWKMRICALVVGWVGGLVVGEELVVGGWLKRLDIRVRGRMCATGFSITHRIYQELIKDGRITRRGKLQKCENIPNIHFHLGRVAKYRAGGFANAIFLYGLKACIQGALLGSFATEVIEHSIWR